MRINSVASGLLLEINGDDETASVVVDIIPGITEVGVLLLMVTLVVVLAGVDVSRDKDSFRKLADDEEEAFWYRTVAL